METHNTQQEVILVTGTGFTSKQYREKDSLDGAKNLSEAERLQEACWNGLIQEKLPEIFFHTHDADRLYLWQLKEGSHTLSLELGEFPQAIDPLHSIDPYAFLVWQGEN